MVYFVSKIHTVCVYLGMKMTAKRQQVCREFFRLTAPIDAESFWLQLANAGIKVSRAQVYNILNLLATQGSASRVAHTDGKLYYSRLSVITV